MRRLFQVTTAATTLALTVASGAIAQDWFRQRTFGGESYPVTTAAERVRQKAAQRRLVNQLAATATYAATGLPLAIPDSPAPGVSSTINVPANAPQGSVTVSLDIQHTYRGDLRVTLTSPGGTVFVLSDNEGGGADDILITDQAITLPQGGAAVGAWLLEIVDLAGADVGQLLSWSLTLGGGSGDCAGAACIDLSMSLEANPTGDDNGATQGVSGSEAQDKWERIIQHYADAVYEMTNGAQKIRTVRVFRSGKNSASADIRWGVKGHPHVPSNGGVAVPGGHIMMYEIFENGSGSSDYDMLADEPGSGYTMAHEWGHYYLGLYDEYADACSQLSTVLNCVSVDPSIMNSQWKAVGTPATVAHRWLNFSIRNQGGGDFQDTLANWQHSAYGASAWEVLSRPVSDDPEDPDGLRILGPRTHYPELSGVAPAGAATPSIELNSGTTAARSSLRIIWMSDRHDVEIVIDRSGSMAGAKLNQAKAAAKLLVDQAELGKSRYGVTAFDHTVTNVMALTLINTDADRSAIKTAIDGIGYSGATAIGEAAAAALAKLQALNAAGENKAVFLLSDGHSNSGRDPLSVIPSYTSASIPLFTFGFGADADPAVMQQLAAGTGGSYFFSPTTLAEITAAFQAANLVATSNPGLASAALSPSVGTPALATVPVDGSLSRLRLTVVYTGSAPTSVVSFLSPTSQSMTPASTGTGGAGEKLVYFDINEPPAGNWKVRIDNAGAGTSYSYTVTGTHRSVGYTVDTAIEGVNTRANVTIQARLSRRQAIIGASVVARITAPAGATATLPLLDNGVSPDATANDGTYTAKYLTAAQGSYAVYVEASNPNATAVETYGAILPTPATNGMRALLPADVAVSESFVRSQATQFAPSVDTACTVAGAADSDLDGIPDTVEAGEGTLVCVRDNNVFTNARLFAMQQYRDFLKREGDSAGILYWTAAITGGASRASVTKAFFDSPEFQGTIAPVARLYFAYFNRIPDLPGLEYWITQYRAGMGLNSISEAFALSPEFVGTYGTLNNSQFVTLVYQNVLGRAPEAAGLAYWLGQLNGGFMTRGQVMVGFSESTEYRASSYGRVFVTMTYYGMLHRMPDLGGFNYWVGQLNGGASALTLINGFLTAPEYHSRFLP